MDLDQWISKVKDGQHLSEDELQLLCEYVNGKVSKPVLKERFKVFNTMFDEIHKTQSTWIVSDEQMQSELRVSIAAFVIPAYRSFFGRYKQHIDSGRHSDKYVKYQPEDIETYIDDLFDGNPPSMALKRT
ncbi:exocyst subunit exo70 family protein C1 [Raphanus sativus]|uniref:Exocyst subunit Exo70 family protein n=1 Tax=Raphanus sativus TaxID=3726 RepID=A0A9W3CBU3_RAPSA|nr:exocyst complex component EXO70A3-like [Raphanus sativus]KAJ4879304.1 exocyst subunit exo70 family protein C1 [Raphanus sativus]